MHILITGGAGYIGSHCAKLLHQHGHTITVLDNLERGHRDAVRWGQLLEVDLRDRAAVIQALADNPVDAVIHFAALAYVGESMQAPEQYFHTNVTGTQNLLDAMLAAGVNRIVFSSTCATYGEPEHMPITEDMPQQPVNPYGQSKYMVEQMLRWYGECHGLQWAALRYFNVVGSDPEGDIGENHDPETHLLPIAIQAALGQRPPLQVFGNDYPTNDGTAIRDYVHVWDLVEAHRLALQALTNGDNHIICNLATGQGASVTEVIAAVEDATGCPVPHTIAPRRPGDPAELWANADRAATVLGWRPQFTDLRDAVRHATNWFKLKSAAAPH